MKLTLNNVRLSFPNLFEPEKFDDQASPRYGCALLVSKDHKQLADIEAAIEEVCKEKWTKRWSEERFRKNVKVHAFKDGDEKDYDGYEGCMYVVANRAEKKGRPVIIDRNKQPLTAEDGRPYAGCYVDAQVDFWADDRYGKAVNCTLLAIRFRADGEEFQGASARATVDDFEDLEEVEEDDVFS